MHFELLCIMHFKVTRKLFISNHRYNKIQCCSENRTKKCTNINVLIKDFFMYKYIKYKFAKSDCSGQCSKIGKKGAINKYIWGFLRTIFSTSAGASAGPSIHSQTLILAVWRFTKLYILRDFKSNVKGPSPTCSSRDQLETC